MLIQLAHKECQLVAEFRFNIMTVYHVLSAFFKTSLNKLTWFKPDTMVCHHYVLPT